MLVIRKPLYAFCFHTYAPCNNGHNRLHLLNSLLKKIGVSDDIDHFIGIPQ